VSPSADSPCQRNAKPIEMRSAQEGSIRLARKPKTPVKICRPAAGRGPAVLVVHSWWGLTPSFVDFGDALVARGFVVGLADLFDGHTASRPADAQALRRAPRAEPMYRTLIRNIGELRADETVDGETVGVVGFSMGGHWAVWLAQRPELPIAATVLYYACRAGNFGASRSAFLAHFAETDDWVSRASRRRMEQAIAKAGHPYTAFDYPGTSHWFAERNRAGEYDAEAAALALDRTTSFFDSTLRT